MVFYHKLGKIPHKRHTAFRNPEGGLYPEHLMGNLGFSGIKSLLYTLRPPTRLSRIERLGELRPEAEPGESLHLRHFRTHNLPAPGPSAVLNRIPLLFNEDVALSLARPSLDDPFFYRNGQADEVVFVTEGEGVLESQMGELDYRQGDYLVIPKGIIHRFRLASKNNIFLIFESRGYVRTPARYRNMHGQLIEHSPYCERDIRPPALLATPR